MLQVFNQFDELLFLGFGQRRGISVGQVYQYGTVFSECQRYVAAVQHVVLGLFSIVGSWLRRGGVRPLKLVFMNAVPDPLCVFRRLVLDSDAHFNSQEIALVHGTNNLASKWLDALKFTWIVPSTCFHYIMKIELPGQNSVDYARKTVANGDDTAVLQADNGSELQHVFHSRPARARRQGPGVPEPFREAPIKKEAA